jgi:hypothetical protein
MVSFRRVESIDDVLDFTYFEYFLAEFSILSIIIVFHLNSLFKRTFANVAIWLLEVLLSETEKQ